MTTAITPRPVQDVMHQVLDGLLPPEEIRREAEDLEQNLEKIEARFLHDGNSARANLSQMASLLRASILGDISLWGG